MKTKMLIRDNIYDEEIYQPTNHVFTNTVQLKEREWSTHIDAEKLAKLWMDQELVYYPDSQRGLKLQKNKKGELEEKAVYSAKNIKEIQNRIVKNEYHPDQITLNLLSDGEDEVTFENNELKINGVLCVLDGQHRIKALANIYQSNKLFGEGSEQYVDLKSLVFPVKITNYNKDDAAQQFYQYTLGLKISKSLAESFNKKDSVNKIVSELDKIGALKGKIDKTKTSISANDSVHITTFATMVNAINDSYGMIEDEKMEKDVLEFLQLFFKELVKIFPEMINDKERELSKKYELTCENFLMYGWIEISQLLYCTRFNEGKWKQQLANMTKINFNKLNEEGDDVNPIWRSILRYGEGGKTYITNNKSTRQVVRGKMKEQFYLAQNN